MPSALKVILYSFLAFGILLGSFDFAYARTARTELFMPMFSADLYPYMERGYARTVSGMRQGRVNFSTFQGAPGRYGHASLSNVANDLGVFLQQSNAASNIFMPAGHGSLGVPGTFFGGRVPRDQAMAQFRRVADSLGKDVVVVDYSCGSGACLHPSVSQHIGGHLKGVITLSPAGRSGYTSQLEGFFEDVGRNFARVDTNGDGALTLGELEDYARTRRTYDPTSGRWVDGSPFQFHGDRDHVMFYHEDHPGIPAQVCIVLPPGDDSRYGDAIRERMRSAEILRGTPPNLEPTLQDHIDYQREQERIKREGVEAGSGEDVELYFYTPTEANLQQFIDTMPQAIYEINELDVRVGSYPIGATTLMNDRSGEQQSITFKIVGDEECTAEPIQYETLSDPSNWDGSRGNGGGAFGQAEAAAMLPLLGMLQDLFGRQGMGDQEVSDPRFPDTPPSEDSGCPLVYDPVCGIDGVTYSNECVATDRHGISIAHEGACIPAQTESSVQRSVPDSVLSSVMDVIRRIFRIESPLDETVID